MVAVDTETDGLDSIGAGLVGVSLAIAPNKACYIPLAHGGTDLFSDAPQMVAMDVAMAKLAGLLADDAVDLEASAADWEDAVTQAGRLLESTGAIDPAYTQAMIDSVQGSTIARARTVAPTL